MSELGSILEELRELEVLYDKLLELEGKEKNALIKADTSELDMVIELKKYMALRIGELQDRLGRGLKNYNVDSLDGLKAVVGDTKVSSEISTIHGSLKALVEEIKRLETLNFYIAQEHMRFYNALLSLYSTAMGRSVGYNREARIEIKGSQLNVRV